MTMLTLSHSWFPLCAFSSTFASSSSASTGGTAAAAALDRCSRSFISRCLRFEAVAFAQGMLYALCSDAKDLKTVGNLVEPNCMH